MLVIFNDEHAARRRARKQRDARRVRVVAQRIG